MSAVQKLDVLHVVHELCRLALENLGQAEGGDQENTAAQLFTDAQSARSALAELIQLSTAIRDRCARNREAAGKNYRFKPGAEKEFQQLDALLARIGGAA